MVDKKRSEVRGGDVQVEEPEGSREVSRSARKREANRIEALAMELLDLSPELWEQIPGIEDLRASLEEAHRLKRKGGVRGGLRRQIRHLAGVLRTMDAQAVAEAIGRHGGPSDRERALQEVERWRSEIIARGDAGIDDLLNAFPDAGADRQRLRQLALQAARETKQDKPPKAFRQLFAYLRKVVGV